MAIDLGMTNLATSACTDRTTVLWSGGELAALEWHFDKQKSKTTRSRSRKTYVLNKNRSRQRSHQLHSFTRSLVSDADARGVSTIIVGDLTDIRDGKHWGDSGNQQLHKWPFDKIIKMLTYKARLKSIRVVKEAEEDVNSSCFPRITRVSVFPHERKSHIKFPEVLRPGEPAHLFCIKQ